MLYRVFSGAPSQILNIECFGYSKNPAETRCGPISRPLYIIHFCISGKGFFNDNPVNVGEGFLIYPNQYVEYHPDAENPWEYVWIASYDNRIKPFMDEYAKNSKNGIFSFSQLFSVQNLRDYILHNCHHVVDGNIILERFLHLFNNHNLFSGKSLKSTNDYFNLACRYIETNYNSHVTVEDLTKILGISQPYLYRLFKENIGLSPKEYINDKRLSIAKDMLTKTDFSVSEIATAVGYPDLQAFLRFFKKHCKLTPTKYRK